MSSITESELRLAAETGGVLRLTLRPNGAAFELHARTARGEERTLVKTRYQDGRAIPRRFPNPTVALALLHRAGIHEVTVNLEGWLPDERTATPARPDTAARMKEAHEALSKQKERRTASVHSTEPAAAGDQTVASADVDAVSTDTPGTPASKSGAITTSAPPASAAHTEAVQTKNEKRPSPKPGGKVNPVSGTSHFRKSGIKTDTPVDAWFARDNTPEKT